VRARSDWSAGPRCLVLVFPWYLYPSLLMHLMVRPQSVKVWFEWTAASASYQARDAASVVRHQSRLVRVTGLLEVRAEFGAARATPAGSGLGRTGEDRGPRAVD
jgi:hypothetical protein